LRPTGGVNRHVSQTDPPGYDICDGQWAGALQSDLLELLNHISVHQEKKLASVPLVDECPNLPLPPKVVEVPLSSGLLRCESPVSGSIDSWSPRNQDIGSFSDWNNSSPSSSMTRSTVSTVSIADDPLPQVLHALDSEADDCIVVVRKITRLGFKAPRLIKSYCHTKGWNIKSIVLLPSRSRNFNEVHSSFVAGTSHSRPSSMGFVVFRNPESAREFAATTNHNINGIGFTASRFSRQYKPTTR